MAQIEIKNRFTGTVLFTCELPADVAELSVSRQLGYAIREAVKAGANLADANLAGANLADAYLAGANLADANLAGANLADANLADAYLADANLAGANLADANLADANLADANLADAYLADANLAGANLADAYLAGANLADAYLAGANLAGAYLAGAYLAGANLAGANLAGAYLAGAYLAGANLAGANLAGARNVPAGVEATSPAEPYARVTGPERYANRAAKFRERNPDVPVIEHIDAKILAAIEAGGKLEMCRWHTCETTHCMAGWAITLAGEAGKALESRHGAAMAGRFIYLASTGHVPHFYASNDHAMEDLKARAAEQSAA